MHGTVARELAVFMKISLNPKMTRMTQFFPEGRGAGASLRLGVAGGPLVAALGRGTRGTRGTGGTLGEATEREGQVRATTTT